VREPGAVAVAGRGRKWVKGVVVMEVGGADEDCGAAAAAAAVLMKGMAGTETTRGRVGMTGTVGVG
jgi:hypothetical protein